MSEERVVGKLGKLGKLCKLGKYLDELFNWCLDKLSNCRDLLTSEEEDFINNLAQKFQHIR